MLKRPRLGLPKQEDGAGRAPFVIALVLQFAMLAVLASVLSVPVINFFRHEVFQNPEERVTFIEPPPPPKTTAVRTTPPVPIPPKPSPVPPPSGGPPPPATVTPPPVTPPVEIPPTVTPPRTAGGDTVDKRIVGRGGIPGLSPGVVDPRLLGIAPVVPYNGPVRLGVPSTDSAVRSWVRSYWDSIAVVQANSKNPQDWTVERNGKKYGMDPQFIYFGKFRLPTMLLAMLPIYTQANPSATQRNRQLESMRQDIMFQAMRAANEEDFSSAVKALRARKEAEHQADLAKKAAAAGKPPDGKPPQ